MEHSRTVHRETIDVFFLPAGALSVTVVHALTKVCSCKAAGAVSYCSCSETTRLSAPDRKTRIAADGTTEGAQGKERVVAKLTLGDGRRTQSLLLTSQDSACAFGHCPLSDLVKRLRQFGCAELVLEAFDVVGNRRKADF